MSKDLTEFLKEKVNGEFVGGGDGLWESRTDIGIKGVEEAEWVRIRKLVCDFYSQKGYVLPRKVGEKQTYFSFSRSDGHGKFVVSYLAQVPEILINRL